MERARSPLALAHEAFHEGRRPMPLWRDCLLGRCRARDGINVSLYLRLGAIKQRSKILPRRTNRDHREMTPTMLELEQGQGVFRERRTELPCGSVH